MDPAVCCAGAAGGNVENVVRQKPEAVLFIMTDSGSRIDSFFDVNLYHFCTDKVLIISRQV